MRGIKFRCWYENEMYHWDLLKQDAPCLEYLQSSKLMQYTGLKDKNGVEIYENDILRYSVVNCSWMKNQIGVVEWGKRKAGWLLNKSKYAIPSDCEVIGNIHQNPELLK